MRPLLYLALTLLLVAGWRPRPAAAAPLPPRRLPPGGQLATGYNYSLLLQADGTLYAWGRNNYGQLGTGTATASSGVPTAVAPGAIPAGVRLVQVAAGMYHSLALGSNGLVYAWGYNGSGELGNGTANNSRVPVAVTLPAGVRIVQVSAGSAHSLALAADGTAYAWGDNSSGQLGTGTTTDSPVPVAVAPGAMPAGTRLVQVAAGSYHNLALTADGTAYAWGFNQNAQLGTGNTLNSYLPVAVAQGAMPTGTRLTQVSAGSAHNLALAADGTAYAWGNNSSGQLGAGTTSSREPVAVAPGAMPAGTRLTQVVAGYFHSLALAADGTAYTWGDNYYGQLGNNSTFVSAVPVAVAQGGLPLGTRLARLAPGNQTSHALALAADGTVYTWGNNDNGQLGTGSLTNSLVPMPVALPTRPTGYQQAAASQYVSLGLGADGTAYAWGENAQGQLGAGSTTASLVPVPVAQGTLPTGTRLLQVAAGGNHCLALAADGTACAWGFGGQGQLGTGTTTARTAPGPVAQGAMPTGTRLTQVAAGASHSLALAADGTAYSWGYNAQSQLGNNSTTTSLLPVAVLAGAMPAGTRLVQVAAGGFHNLALAADGTVYAWGYNYFGQLGNGTDVSGAVPVAVSLPAGVRIVQVAAGNQHSLALAADGTLYAWGLNGAGQLGDSYTDTRQRPVAVALPSGVRLVQVAAGAQHSLGLAANGILYTWGFNNYGQLGINSTTGSLVPVAEVSNTTQWRGAAASPFTDHSLVIGPGAAIYTTGRNDVGQLGDGTTTNALVFLRSRAPLPVRPLVPGGPSLTCYPNPAPGGLATLGGAAPGAAVQVLDALGRVVATATAGDNGTVRLGGLAPGLYLVRAGTGSLRLAVE